MARKVISSGGREPNDSQDQVEVRSQGRTIQSREVSNESGSSHGRSISGTAGRSQDGGFVDARNLVSEDFIAKTLQETTGTLGVATRPKVVDFSERLQERRRANARMVVLRACIAGTVAIVVATLVWLLFFSDVFRLETGNISVAGSNEWVSQSQVLDIAKKQAGKSILLVSDAKVEEEIKDIPGVTAAESKKQFPKSLRITIKAQKPAAMLQTDADTMTAVDSKGRVLNSVNGASVEGIPVIEVKDVETSLKNRSIREALTILSSLPESMRKTITKVTADTQDSITTELNGGERVIVWGDSSDLKLKKAVVDKIINDPNVIGDKHNVDVSAPLRPIIK